MTFSVHWCAFPIIGQMMTAWYTFGGPFHIFHLVGLLHDHGFLFLVLCLLLKTLWTLKPFDKLKENWKISRYRRKKISNSLFPHLYEFPSFFLTFSLLGCLVALNSLTMAWTAGKRAHLSTSRDYITNLVKKFDDLGRTPTLVIALGMEIFALYILGYRIVRRCGRIFVTYRCYNFLCVKHVSVYYSLCRYRGL